MSAPVLGPENVFPLHPPGDEPADPAVPAARCRPFGLRYATEPASTMPVDFSTWEYDADRQIAVVRDGGRVVEAAKHSSGPTQTPSGSQDAHTIYERDNDYTED